MLTIMHFDVPADDTGRAKKFYEVLLEVRKISSSRRVPSYKH